MKNTDQQHPSQQILSIGDAPSTQEGSDILHNDTSAQKPAIFTEKKPFAKKRFVLPRKSYKQNKNRSAEKEQLILNFLGSGEVWSSLNILSHVVKIETRQTRVTLNRMVNKNLLQKEILPDGLTIYGITNTGISLVEDKTNSKAFCIGKTPLSTVSHHLLSQKVRLLFKSIKATGWLCGKAIYKNKNYHLINLADGYFQFQGMTCVLEVELFVKSDKRFKVILENYLKDMGSDQYGKPLLGRVFYFTPHTELIEKLIDKYVPTVLRSRFSVISLNTDIPPYCPPEKLMKSVQVKKDEKHE